MDQNSQNVVDFSMTACLTQILMLLLSYIYFHMFLFKKKVDHFEIEHQNMLFWGRRCGTALSPTLVLVYAEDIVILILHCKNVLNAYLDYVSL